MCVCVCVCVCRAYKPKSRPCVDIRLYFGDQCVQHEVKDSCFMIRLLTH